jgi:hypothetical protein
MDTSFCVVTTPMRSSSFSIFSLHFLQAERPDLAYSHVRDDMSLTCKGGSGWPLW